MAPASLTDDPTAPTSSTADPRAPAPSSDDLTCAAARCRAPGAVAEEQQQRGVAEPAHELHAVAGDDEHGGLLAGPGRPPSLQPHAGPLLRQGAAHRLRRLLRGLDVVVLTRVDAAARKGTSLLVTLESLSLGHCGHSAASLTCSLVQAGTPVHSAREATSPSLALGYSDLLRPRSLWTHAGSLWTGRCTGRSFPRRCPSG
eukprot:61614-Prorocentrum_minimum.AAC.1